MNPYELSSIATILGFLIAPTLTVDEQNSLGNFLELTAQVILTINAQETTLEANNDNNDSDKEVDSLKKEIAKLKVEVTNLQKK